MQKTSRLFNRNFYLLWQGQSISNLGVQGFSIAMLFWLKHATDSATIVGLVMMVSALPAILFSPIGGAFADRHSRRNILVIANLFNAAAVFSLVAMLTFFPENTHLILVWIFIVSVLVELAYAFFNPAITASIPDLVPADKLMSANSLGSISYQLAVFLGQGIGGTLFRILGAPVLFLINSVTYLFAGISNVFINIPQRTSPTGHTWQGQVSQFKVDIVAGLHYVWERTGLRNLVLVSAILAFFGMPIIVLLAFFVEDTLKVSVDWYGFIMAAYGVGSMLGYVAAGAVRMSGRARGRLMIVLIILEAFGYGMLGLATGPVMALIFAALGGVMGGFVTINITTLVQSQTPADIRGRVFGLLSTISAAISPLAMGLSGIIADLLDQNIRLVYVLCGLIMGVLVLLVSTSSSFRQYVSFQPTEQVEYPASTEALP